MPREKINHAAPFVPRADGVSGPAIHGEAWPEPEVEISWSREGDHGIGFAQVGIRCPRAYILDLAAELGRDESQETIGVFSPGLDRRQLNQGIQVLRRARDQAYGRDE